MSKSLGIAIAVLACLAAAPARADKPRIAVTGVGGDGAPIELRERIARAVAEGLAAAGADVRTEPALIAYRVRGTLNVEGRTYMLHLEIVDAQTGAVVDGRDDRCEICTESEALETAGVAASALKAQVFKKRPTLSMGEVGLPGAAGPNPPPAQIAAPGPVAPPPAVKGHRALGWTGVAVGAVAAGIGAALIPRDDYGRDCSLAATDECPRLKTLRPVGIGLLAGGVLALTAGIMILAGSF